MREFFEFTGVSLGLSTIFLGVTTFHRMGLSEAGYVTSPLIKVEMLLLLILLLGAFTLSMAVIAQLIMRKWKQAGYMALNTIILFLAAFIGMAIDAPTLIYMT